MAGIPAYRRVYSELKQQLREGRYPVGSLLPTEPELDEIFQVSRTTVRRAVSLLVAEGWLKPTQGRGTEVMDVSTTQRLNRISSITETLAARGYRITTQGMCIKKVPAPPQAAAALELEPGDPVYEVQRVQCADGAPIALMTNYLRINFVPNLEQYTDTFTGLYDLLEKAYHIIFLDATEYLSAEAASFTESQILRVPMGSPLLCSRRVTRAEQGVFEYSVNKLVADKYEYSVYLQGRK